jgi:hypothetical protein
MGYVNKGAKKKAISHALGVMSVTRKCLKFKIYNDVLFQEYLKVEIRIFYNYQCVCCNTNEIKGKVIPVVN